MLQRPTFRNLTESFEGWAYRRGFLRHLQRLERGELLERKTTPSVERIYRLTESGRLAALGGIDPVARWDRAWDGGWHAVSFDLPEKHNKSRVRLRRFLKHRGFGCLQRSLWISPDPLDDEVKTLVAGGMDVESMLTLEARPSSGERDFSIVTAAWDFEHIGRLYEDCLRVLQNPPRAPGGGTPAVQSLWEWAGEERLAWRAVLRRDPFLPSCLLPPGYRGREVWALRGEVLKAAGQWLPP